MGTARTPWGKANRDVAGGAVAKGYQWERGQEWLHSREVRKGSTEVGELGTGWSQRGSRHPNKVCPPLPWHPSAVDRNGERQGEDRQGGLFFCGGL